jgi:hypothetical protein
VLVLGSIDERADREPDDAGSDGGGYWQLHCAPENRWQKEDRANAQPTNQMAPIHEDTSKTSILAIAFESPGDTAT